MKMTEDLKRYMREIGEFLLLELDEEVCLANAARHGDPTAMDKLISSNLRLVITIALELSNRSIEIDELVSAGNVGLIKAARRFDPQRGVKLASYAAWWIKQTMRRAITESSKPIRIPTSSLCKIRRLNRVWTVRLHRKDAAFIPTSRFFFRGA